MRPCCGSSSATSRAERFYDMDGWRPDGQRRLVEVHGITVDEIRYLRPLS